MSVQLTVRDASITNGMKRYAEEKADRLYKYFDGITTIEVILAVDGPHQTAEMVLSVAKGETIAAKAEHEQMNAAIDAALDRAERILVKHKEKLREHRGGAMPPPLSETEPEEKLETYQDIIENTEFPK